MLKSDRQREIMKTLRTRGSVEINQLGRVLGVTEMTVRRDLDELTRKGGIIRIHGGAALSEGNILSEPPFDIRNTRCLREKEAIAAAALALVRDGQKIILDSGTTTFSLARMIDNSRRLVVVTNAVNIAAELSLRSNISVISVGGEVRSNTLSCVGYFAIDMIRKLKVDITFLGASGIGETGNITSTSTLEIGVKQAMLEAGKQTIVLADSSKIGREELAVVANLKETDLLITDSHAPRKLVREFRKKGIRIEMTD